MSGWGGVSCWQGPTHLSAFFLTAGPVPTNGRAVLPPLGQSVPDVLNTPPHESKLRPALYYQRDQEKCFGHISCSIHSATFDSHSY